MLRFRSWATSSAETSGRLFFQIRTARSESAITNQIKSALRGVPDFTSPAYSNPSQWYPDPALKTGGQNFNVFNLDPFIWFIHQKLGLSAYAFGLDDDIGDVGAGRDPARCERRRAGRAAEAGPQVPRPIPVREHGQLWPRAGHGHASSCGRLQRHHWLALQVVNQIAGANFSNNTARGARQRPRHPHRHDGPGL